MSVFTVSSSAEKACKSNFFSSWPCDLCFPALDYISQKFLRLHSFPSEQFPGSNLRLACAFEESCGQDGCPALCGLLP